MPSGRKTLHFLVSALVTTAGAAVLGYGMSAEWAISKMECSAQGSSFFNGSATVQLGLFNGFLIKSDCPSFGSTDKLDVLKKLGVVGGAPLILHGIIIGLLALSLLSSACTILITLYNSVSNPYETYMGPLGVYTCSSISAVLSFLALILFLVNMLVVGVPQELVQENVAVELQNENVTMQVGFYMLIPYLVTSLLAILSVYLYEHMAYTQRKEQQRPTEDAPKEIMMY
ncbi:clarin-3 [Megalops cyprinoides]|uniref:clarin-3 n=1 Tax=Megalops cyprinoides TaxID=118141 RepID=UPI0018654481|nr:clarin-3 [Megalops cyprinoides]